MRSIWKSVVACSAVAVVLSLAGCNPADEGETETGTTAAQSTGDEAPGNKSPGGKMPTQTPPAGPVATGPDATSPEPAPPTVVIETSLGNITVELDQENAPATVDNFLEYVESRFYDGTIFDQVWPGAVILGGMFTQDLQEKPAGPPINNEAHNGLKNVRGTIAMAREYDRINSATCQFFINVKDNPNYDHKPDARESLNPEDYGYCVFGRVTADSMDVVDRIANVEVHDQGDFERIPVQTVLIRSVRRIR